ncbi:MAG: hypothetical protein CL678_10135 [Bdellovibrionaceae bacterium]|nr:hypothetical protein [Pseudobdellovibrionaceae bacterium]|tara:strand:- start:4122 stop:4313 length:192 start_codon:yes stop_codon:yes gene_type:complete
MLKNFIQRLWKDESGQSTTEYILILAVVVMIAVKFKKVLQEQILDNAVGKLSEKMGTAFDGLE